MERDFFSCKKCGEKICVCQDDACPFKGYRHHDGYHFCADMTGIIEQFQVAEPDTPQDAAREART